jgi:hypothetical protein
MSPNQQRHAVKKWRAAEIARIRAEADAKLAAIEQQRALDTLARREAVVSSQVSYPKWLVMPSRAGELGLLNQDAQERRFSAIEGVAG